MPVQNQKGFVSVKEDEILHGYGMKNIQDIVRKYDGIFRYKNLRGSIWSVSSRYMI